jgi:hypothetical protein
MSANAFRTSWFARAVTVMHALVGGIFKEGKTGLKRLNVENQT